MNNSVFGKTMKNVRKYRDIWCIENYLVSEPNYKTTKFLSKNLLAMEMRKTQIIKNKPVYLGLAILEISKIVCMNFDMIT